MKIPEELEEELELELRKFGESYEDSITVNLNDLFNYVEKIFEKPDKVIKVLMKMSQAVNNYYQHYSKKVDEVEQKIEDRRAKLNVKYSIEDEDTNPLYEKGMKVTNRNVKQAVNDDNKLKNLKEKRRRLNNKKGHLFGVKKDINSTIDFCKTLLKFPNYYGAKSGGSVFEGDGEKSERAKDLANKFSDNS